MLAGDTDISEMLLRMPEVCRRTGRTRDQVYRDIRAGLFPAPLKRGQQSVWVASEVQAAGVLEDVVQLAVDHGAGRLPTTAVR